MTHSAMYVALSGAKVTKIVGDIATKSYKMYDRDGDGKLSEEEITEMQVCEEHYHRRPPQAGPHNTTRGRARPRHARPPRGRR